MAQAQNLRLLQFASKATQQIQISVPAGEGTIFYIYIHINTHQQISWILPPLPPSHTYFNKMLRLLLRMPWLAGQIMR